MFHVFNSGRTLSLPGFVSLDHCSEGQLQQLELHPHLCINLGISQQDNCAEKINSGVLNIQNISQWLIFLLLWGTLEFLNLQTSKSDLWNESWASQPPKPQFPPGKWELAFLASRTVIPTYEGGGWASQNPRVHKPITFSDPELELVDVFLKLWPNFSMMSTKRFQSWGTLIPPPPGMSDPRWSHWEASSQQSEDDERDVTLTWVCILGQIHRIMESLSLEKLCKTIKSNLWLNTTRSTGFQLP